MSAMARVRRSNVVNLVTTLPEHFLQFGDQVVDLEALDTVLGLLYETNDGPSHALEEVMEYLCQLRFGERSKPNGQPGRPVAEILRMFREATELGMSEQFLNHACEFFAGTEAQAAGHDER